jgi:hypothetical protein
VDIDLTHLPLTDRKKALVDIHEALQRIADRIQGKQPGTRINPRISGETDILIGLIVMRDDTTVKVEPNTNMRGAVFPASP